MRVVAGGLAAAAWIAAATAMAQATAVCGPAIGQAGNCTMAVPYAPLSPIGQPQFVYDLPVPVPYEADTTTFPGFDYYEIKAAIASHPSLAFPQVADFKKKNKPTWPTTVPNGKIWLGLIGAGGYPAFTEAWGYGQKNKGGGPLGGLATYPAMSFHAVKPVEPVGASFNPVKVKWVNELPDQHLFCKEPLNSDVPCGIDRTLMGVQLDATGLMTTAPDGGIYGSHQSPDNAMVIHLHGGEIPPDSDGFAELWIGNAKTSTAYLRDGVAINPPLHPPATNGIPADSAYPGGLLDTGDPVTSYPGMIYDPVADPANALDPANPTPADLYDPAAASLLTYQQGQLQRPTGNSIVYNYPMVQDPATIWYHDHALGKTRINVAAGPAGFYIIEDPAFDQSIGLPPRKRVGTADSYDRCLTGDIYPNGNTYGPGNCFDIPVVFQDRSFNVDGSINFPNGLGQVPLAAGANPLTPGPNPLAHPQWVPEYFGDFAVVNGVIWPRLKVEQRAYRFRFLDGSNARCYTFGLKTAAAVGPPVFVHIASDQGYLPAPVPLTSFSLCPGERAEVVIDFSKFAAGDLITITNSANAPFPNGISPLQKNSPFAMMAQLMQFQVIASAKAPWTVPAALVPANNTMPATATPAAWNGAPQGTERTMVLNEVLDPITAAPLRVQIDGKPFEAPITEIPTRGSREVWRIVNTTVDAHPMHLHLVKFRVLSRQKINVNNYAKAINLAALDVGGQLTPVTDLAPYLMNAPRGPDANEVGWKDTAKAFPGEVLTLEAKWDGEWQDGPVMIDNPAYPGDGTVPQFIVDTTKPFWEPVTAGPYVWHCHIVDHEDNEMMRPVLVMPKP